MKKEAFDLKLYLKIQKEAILNRIGQFDNKLYLEFGGKLYDDFHASRVLPGYAPNAKLRLLLELKNESEIVIVVNSNDIISNKARGDIGISYQDEVKRLIDAYNSQGLYVSGVVFSFYKENTRLNNFIHFLVSKKINIYKHYEIEGYPNNIELVASASGFGKNEYIKTTRKLVIITAPGPGSGKMAVCLSQLYLDSKNNIRSGYAKFETFPVWNLPVKHPLNIAYEAATVDLGDVNMIDNYHFDAYNKLATSYNRDLASFPLLRSLFDKIYGRCPYKSPTDMGINKVGFAIADMDGVIKASNEEIIRRYYTCLKNNFLGSASDASVTRSELLVNEANISISDRKCVKVCLDKAHKEGVPVVAIEKGKKIITGKRSELLGAPAALILNTLKSFANIKDNIDVLSPNVIAPIKDLKIKMLHNHNPRIHLEEVLLILAIQAENNPLAALCLKQIPKLKGLQVHSSVILPVVDLKTFNKLGINVTEEPLSYAGRIYNK